jgi:hypothetical protein
MVESICEQGFAYTCEVEEDRQRSSQTRAKERATGEADGWSKSKIRSNPFRAPGCLPFIGVVPFKTCKPRQVTYGACQILVLIVCACWPSGSGSIEMWSRATARAGASGLSIDLDRRSERRGLARAAQAAGLQRESWCGPAGQGPLSSLPGMLAQVSAPPGSGWAGGPAVV